MAENEVKSKSVKPAEVLYRLLEKTMSLYLEEQFVPDPGGDEYWDWADEQGGANEASYLANLMIRMRIHFELPPVSRPGILHTLNELRRNFEANPCDHSVGICACADRMLIDDLEALAGLPVPYRYYERNQTDDPEE